MSTSATPHPADPVKYQKRGTDEFVDADEDLERQLAEAQRMQHVLLLIGSGASLHAGGPSTRDLWSEVVPDPTAANEVLSLVGYANVPAPNVEELLSRCDAWLQISDGHSQRQKVTDFRSRAIENILKRCGQAGMDATKLDAHKDLLRKVCRRRTRDHRARIFTTNYDLCIEHAAGAVGITLLDGFSFGTTRWFDPRFLEMDIVERQADQADPGPFVPGAAVYMKLHGSVNWSRDELGTKAVAEWGHVEAEKACIVYPARTKYELSYTSPYFDLMSRFLAALRQPNTCLITIGFGFNDDHFLKPIERAVETNPHFRLVPVAPDADKASNAWKRFRDHAQKGRDVVPVRATFESFVGLLPSFTALSPADELLTAVKKAVK